MEGVVGTVAEVGMEVVVVGVEVVVWRWGQGRRHLFHLEAALRPAIFGVREILLAHLDELAARAAGRQRQNAQSTEPTVMPAIASGASVAAHSAYWRARS